MLCVPKELENLLHPLCKDKFLEEFWGKSFVHIEGPPKKFNHVFSWSQLNYVLRYHRLKPPRLRLFRSGTAVPAQGYIKVRPGREPLLSAAELRCRLAEGATLILDEVCGTSEALFRLTSALEYFFHARVQANAYAAWRTDNGFDLHWDEQDTFILQIPGRKYWRIFEPTRLHPLRQDEVEAPRPDTTSIPAWDSVLKEGEMLYIPRGWWHVVRALDEPSLHITVGCSNPTGIDLLHWLVEELKSCDEVRMSIPTVGSQFEQEEFAKCLTRSLARISQEGNVVRRYLAAVNAEEVPQSPMKLPDVTSPEALEFTQATEVRLTAPRSLDLPSGTETELFQVKFGTNVRECSPALLPVLRCMEDRDFHGLDELAALVDQSSCETELHALLREMGKSGYLDIRTGSHVDESLRTRQSSAATTTAF
jgi:ribosomal protein L16 Arg81 hydroxylase